MKIRNVLYALGVAFSLVGVPLGMYMNQIVGGSGWSPITMFFSIILLVRWRGLSSAFIYISKTPLKWMIVFQLMMVIYGIFSDNRMTGQYLSFHLYIIALCIGYATHRTFEFVRFIPKTTFYLSLIASLLGAYFCSLGMVTGDEAYMLRQMDDSYALEMFTIAGGSLTNFFAALTFKKEHIWEKVLFTIAITMDIYVLISCTKRTPVFVAIVGTLIYLYKSGFAEKRILRKYAKYIMLFIIGLLYAYFSIDSFHIGVDDMFSRLYDGIRVLLGDESAKNIQDSAQARVQARNWAYHYIGQDFSFGNYIFGAGYMTKWIDVPILQAYLDMGLIGIFLYGYLVGWTLLHSLLKKYINPAGIFAIVSALYVSLSMFNSGNPYQYVKYTGACFLIFVFYTRDKQGKLIAIENVK